MSIYFCGFCRNMQNIKPNMPIFEITTLFANDGKMLRMLLLTGFSTVPTNFFICSFIKILFSFYGFR